MVGNNGGEEPRTSWESKLLFTGWVRVGAAKELYLERAEELALGGKD